MRKGYRRISNSHILSICLNNNKVIKDRGFIFSSTIISKYIKTKEPILRHEWEVDKIIIDLPLDFLNQVILSINRNKIKR